MIDEAKLMIALRPAVARRLHEMHTWALEAADEILGAGGPETRDEQWRTGVHAQRELLKAIDRARAQLAGELVVTGLLRQACEQALAWLTNVNTADYGDVVRTLCDALRHSGGDIELLDDIERTAFGRGFAARPCAGECDSGEHPCSS